MESGSKSVEELFANYPALYKCTEIIWLSNNNENRSEQTAQALINLTEKSECLPVPKYLQIIKNEKINWNISPYRFKHLIKTYCHLYKDMYSAIQKQQEVLQVHIRILRLNHM